MKKKSKKIILSRQEILHLAKLAKLRLTENEVQKFQKQLSAIVDYFSKLNEVNTDNVEPVSQITELVNENVDDEINSIRILSLEETLKNSKSKNNDFFKVKSIF
ncbi:Asp-tRNA(Asn)/Glu-tRNA(Gln) amidotransferase GatCAB subunit C [Candidatus Roizmanbacteria bacterium CG02_land_8_20_14_3_00_36_15]|uniref:Aspartyl/glutamyl-tRNA(Asn/Gln) amidotransferase subunit C n=2 Tax=Candidatus Roizmaniibacteriota TaxID=1752723 RepID=A0A2M8KMJ9_9BACT|nr:MAG: Asp-tRNA(Asn)/Glu-tRNA(Gln) amidotransferase GatCAB subunit C [Candidatus Roizmanbacteria bacterium CG03_land_8_20_14_0_80_36_21]PIV37644.1 MAG: Asp-tRNA(Asn)/Glu-tRNA(Gln) amidotransferase GatCAB subunit C [Candidatus Roizmanbacteria bacterium CG02_land_8_20_14_3_00_36_15]PIY69943.1 MAG: Asp-tRNA(Asn)/Glu-tRNA(Gln) amidotransferase GatCAB subunit C [Candidatus Roizmanbacteria bacterium CG_4_10_14_0_8_um_filter_36_36]PJA53474.1 MAG: Asp-tRNA(Asn)/Glu-tRNA(Gln) amidotransferase GatCAB sub